MEDVVEDVVEAEQRGASISLGAGGRRSKRQDRKARRTAAQAVARNAKLAADSAYYFSCRRNRQKAKAQDVEKCKLNDPITAAEKRIFGSQSSTGINFKKYGDIKVKRSGPNADEYPLLQTSRRKTCLFSFDGI